MYDYIFKYIDREIKEQLFINSYSPPLNSFKICLNFDFTVYIPVLVLPLGLRLKKPKINLVKSIGDSIENVSRIEQYFFILFNVN